MYTAHARFLPHTSHAHNWRNKFQIKWDQPRVNNSEKVGRKYIPERIVLLLDKIFPLDLAPREFHWAEQGGGDGRATKKT